MLFPNANDDYDSDSSDDVLTPLEPDLIRAIPKKKEAETSQPEMAMQASMITSNRLPVIGNDYKFPGNLHSEYNIPNQGQYANNNLLPEAQYNLHKLPAQQHLLLGQTL